MIKTLIAMLTPSDCEELSLEHALAEVERELAVRKRIYDQWCTQGKIAYVDARDRYLRMLRAATALQKLIELQESSEDLSAPVEFVPNELDTRKQA